MRAFGRSLVQPLAHELCQRGGEGAEDAQIDECGGVVRD
jgi:hypothetical protein